ncbi:MAG: methyltransferase domain-containing protein [Candidatus Altiarchaeota archaeon]
MGVVARKPPFEEDPELAKRLGELYPAAISRSPKNIQVAERDFVKIALKDPTVNKALSTLGEITPERFLRDYFGRRHMDELTSGVSDFKELPPLHTATMPLVEGDEDLVTKHPYVVSVSTQKFSELPIKNGFELTDYGNEVFDVVAATLSRRVNQPLKVLFIGPGRGIEVYDLIRRFGDRIDVSILAKENLLANPRYLYMRSGNLFPLSSPQEAKVYVEKMKDAQKIGNLEDMSLFRDGEFDLVVFGLGTIFHGSNLNPALNEAKRVLVHGGTAVMPLKDVRNAFDNKQSDADSPSIHGTIDPVSRLCENNDCCSHTTFSFMLTNKNPGERINTPL